MSDHKGLERSASAVVRLLGERGPLTTRQLQDALGVTTNAVREQVAQLLAAGLVQVVAPPLRRGVGRPSHHYALTLKAQPLLMQRADQMLNALLSEIVAQDGAEKLARLLEGAGTRWSPPVLAAPDLAAVQAVFAQRGVSVSLADAGEGLRIRTWHCPYVAVAQAHAGVCAMEARLLEQVLGQPVTLTERIVDGATGCCFRVG